MDKLWRLDFSFSLAEYNTFSLIFVLIFLKIKKLNFVPTLSSLSQDICYSFGPIELAKILQIDRPNPTPLILLILFWENVELGLNSRYLISSEMPVPVSDTLIFIKFLWKIESSIIRLTSPFAVNLIELDIKLISIYLRRFSSLIMVSEETRMTEVKLSCFWWISKEKSSISSANKEEIKNSLVYSMSYFS